MINSEVINRIPTTFMAIAMVTAMISMKAICTRLTGTPSTRARSSWTVIASNGRHNQASTPRTTAPPI